MREEAARPLSFKELTRKLKIGKPEREGFKKLIKEMLADGTLIKIRGNRYGLPSKMNLITGLFECHPNGFGFVTPDGSKRKGPQDLFVGRNKKKGAMHGDRVLARLEGISKEGKRDGTIVRVLERANRSVVGEFVKLKGVSVVKPSEKRLTEEIIIPPRLSLGARTGEIVVAEITRWPSKGHGPSGRVIELLGAQDDPDVEIDILVRKYSLSMSFPAATEKEAEKIPQEIDESELEGRIDLRDKLIVTIDGETAKDFDDAVGIEKHSEGYTLFVAIADVSHYVREGSPLDTEAYKRSTSVYFPDRCIPMLPERLSNGICSLKPKVDRLTMTAELHFDTEGKLKKKKIYKSVIKSYRRLTYTEVKDILAGELSANDPELEKKLRLMENLSRLLCERRFKEGSIDFDLPEPQIIIDMNGQIEDIVRSERNVAHRLIEEFMLAANRAVADEFYSRELPQLYRVHATPDIESINAFSEFVSGFGYHVKQVKDPKLITPKMLQNILFRCNGKSEEKLINHVLLRSMKRAEYSAENSGHFGLAFKDYTHFTSPIRRYPDLVVHRLTKLLIDGKYSKTERERVARTLPEIALQTSTLERNATEAEREIIDLKKAQFMKEKVGESFEGFVSGVTGFGVFVELNEYFVEGLVHISSLLDDYYIFDEPRHRLIGESTNKSFSVGDDITVIIEGVDIARRQIDMLLAKKGGKAVARTGRKARKRL
jgi:ribonuclease R